eukprot:jgi/Mesvir1/24222/Mv10933-RA.1
MRRVLRGLADNCRSLCHLDLEGCRYGMTDEIVTALAPRVPHLRQLDLSINAKVTDASMYALAELCPQLRHLSLHLGDGDEICLNVTDAGIRAIAVGCPGLATLCTRCCPQVTDDGVRAVAENLSMLSRLDVSFTGVTFAGLRDVLVHCPQLRSLVCGYGEVGRDMAGEAGMLQIQELFPVLPLISPGNERDHCS